MKTSNKILLGFFILIFLIPPFLLMSFNNKIKNGRYQVVKHEGQGSNFRSGNFKPYKVIKFMSPSGRALKAMVQHSDSLYYGYFLMGGGDSIRVYNEADTLFVHYFDAQATNDMDEGTSLHVNLKLPSFGDLIINNAEVTIDSSNAALNSDLNVELNGTGLLNIGRVSTRRDTPDSDNMIEFPFNINRLYIRMNEGEVALGSKVDIKQLDVQVTGPGVLTINDGAVIGGMTGSLSGKSSVKANWQYVKRLAALATEQ
jgi:hypothetical protein